MDFLVVSPTVYQVSTPFASSPPLKRKEEEEDGFAKDNDDDEDNDEMRNKNERKILKGKRRIRANPGCWYVLEVLRTSHLFVCSQLVECYIFLGRLSLRHFLVSSSITGTISQTAHRKSHILLVILLVTFYACQFSYA